MEKNFIETGHTTRSIVSVQPIGVGITRRCADFFADSNCLFEFSPLFPGAPKWSGAARFGSRRDNANFFLFFFFARHDGEKSIKIEYLLPTRVACMYRSFAGLTISFFFFF